MADCGAEECGATTYEAQQREQAPAGAVVGGGQGGDDPEAFRGVVQSESDHQEGGQGDLTLRRAATDCQPFTKVV